MRALVRRKRLLFMQHEPNGLFFKPLQPSSLRHIDESHDGAVRNDRI